MSKANILIGALILGGVLLYMTNRRVLAEEIPENNLLLDPDFDNPSSVWDTYQNGSGAQFLNAQEGVDGGGAVGIYYPELDESVPQAFAQWAQLIPVTPAAHYRVKGFLKTEDVVGMGASILISWYDAEQNWLNETEFMAGVIGTNDWVEHSGEIVPVANAMYAGFNCILIRSAGQAWFDKVSMVQI